jgi:hypothetical protein
MTTDPHGSASGSLDPGGRRRLRAFRAADSLAALRPLTGAESDHEAYFAAKAEWRALRDRELPPPDAAGDGDADGLPGATVTVDGHRFHVHGVTHADTAAERRFLREHLLERVADGATVYCEQGIRPMYFADADGVCAMDDYRWALERCRALDLDSHVADVPLAQFDGVAEEMAAVTDRFQDVAFGLLDADGDGPGDRVRESLGAVLSDLLRSHEDFATGEDFEAFRRSQRAARDPAGHLAGLQRYYERTLLPQPLERGWLRRHDRELELVTHARNERQADYAVYHNDTAEEVHLVVGAAHQPGVRYYLERHRDGDRSVDEFELA